MISGMEEDRNTKDYVRIRRGSFAIRVDEASFYLSEEDEHIADLALSLFAFLPERLDALV